MSDSDAGKAKYRLVTRSDFDGLVCAVLLKERGLVDHVAFAHPKDMQDGVVAVTEDCITANLPYAPGVHLAFDHHASEVERVGEQANHVIDPDAPSAARVIYRHYGEKDGFPGIDEDLMAAVDKADSGRLTERDVLDPDGWMLLNFVLDGRTGLGRFQQFRISDFELSMKLIDLCRDRAVGEILADPDVKQRIDLYRAHADRFREQIERCASVHDNLVVVDLRSEPTIWAGNRFLVYHLFPDCNISIQVAPGRGGPTTVFAIGKSIFNRTSTTHVGALCLEYRGGGHEAAGTCEAAASNADAVLSELVARIVADG